MTDAFFYSSTAGYMSLVGSITAVSGSITVSSVVGLPGATPFKLTIDPGKVSEEIVKVTGVGGNTLTVTRGWDGTTATTHDNGAEIRHQYTAEDARLSREHEDAGAGIHGLDLGSMVVGTRDVQILRNKTFQADDVGGVGVVAQRYPGSPSPILAVADSDGSGVTYFYASHSNIGGRVIINHGGASAPGTVGTLDIHQPGAQPGLVIRGDTDNVALSLQKVDGTVRLTIKGNGEINTSATAYLNNVSSSSLQASGDVTASRHISDSAASANAALNVKLSGVAKFSVSNDGTVWTAKDSESPLFIGNTAGSAKVFSARQSGTEKAFIKSDGTASFARLSWVAPTFQNSWQNYGTWQVAGYSIDPFGIVRLRGLVKHAVTTTTGAIFTLPAGLRPEATEMFFAGSNGAYVARIDVDSGGVVSLMSYGTGASAAFVSLSGISFQAV